MYSSAVGTIAFMLARSLAGLSLGSLILSFTTIALAQGEPAPAPAPAPAPVEKPVAPTYAPPPPPPPLATTTATDPAERVETDAEKEDKATDFSKVVGHVGFAYFGSYDVPLGATRTPNTVATQMIGIRTFFSPKVGLDVGLGLGILSGSAEVKSGSTTTTADAPSTLAFSLKVGLPLVLASSRHYAFFIEPQALFGYAGETVKANVPVGGTAVPDTKHNGTRFTLGGAAGAMVQFGFIGMPQLALDATLGLGLDITNAKTEAPDPTAGGGATATRSLSALGFSTLSGSQPWNIFHSNVEVIYFF
jgi:hypothetical protein